MGRSNTVDWTYIPASAFHLFHFDGFKKLCCWKSQWILHNKEGCIFSMVTVSIPPHAEFERNSHRRWLIRKTNLNLPYLNELIIKPFRMVHKNCVLFKPVLESRSFVTINSSSLTVWSFLMNLFSIDLALINPKIWQKLIILISRKFRILVLAFESDDQNADPFWWCAQE